MNLCLENDNLKSVNLIVRENLSDLRVVIFIIEALHNLEIRVTSNAFFSPNGIIFVNRYPFALSLI